MAELSEAGLQTSLQAISQTVGKPAVFIHLDPACRNARMVDIHFLGKRKQVLQTVFLAAKYLKET